MLAATLSTIAIAQAAQEKPVVDAIGMDSGVRTVTTPDYTLTLTTKGGAGLNCAPSATASSTFLLRIG